MKNLMIFAAVLGLALVTQGCTLGRSISKAATGAVEGAKEGFKEDANGLNKADKWLQENAW